MVRLIPTPLKFSASSFGIQSTIALKFPSSTWGMQSVVAFESSHLGLPCATMWLMYFASPSRRIRGDARIGPDTPTLPLGLNKGTINLKSSPVLPIMLQLGIYSHQV